MCERLPGYDRWKTTPPDDEEPCPGCEDGVIIEDKQERESYCSENCGWSTGYDWDAEAEHRAEMSLEDRYGY